MGPGADRRQKPKCKTMHNLFDVNLPAQRARGALDLANTWTESAVPLRGPEIDYRWLALCWGPLRTLFGSPWGLLGALLGPSGARLGGPGAIWEGY